MPRNGKRAGNVTHNMAGNQQVLPSSRAFVHLTKQMDGMWRYAPHYTNPQAKATQQSTMSWIYSLALGVGLALRVEGSRSDA